MKKVLQALIVLLFVSMFAIPAFYYGTLPEEIPSHYNALGEVDDYSGKSMIWFLPIIGLVLGAFIWFVFWKLSKNNPERVTKQLPELFKELFLLFILLLFNYISFTTIQVALGYQESLGRWFLPTILAVVFLILMWFAWRQIGKESKEK